MYEMNSNVVSNAYNTCRGCLKVGSDVRSMSSDEINMYQSWIVKDSTSQTNMHICVLCCYLMKKLKKFIEQCCKANLVITSYLEEGIKQDLHTQFSPIYNLKILPVQISEFTSEVDEETNIFDDNIYVDNEDVPLVMLKSEDSELIDEKNFIITTLKEKVRKRKKKKGKDVVINENESISLEIQNEFNDLETNETCNNDIKLEHHEIKTEIDVDNPKESSKVTKKVLKDGFTSRMRQETDEYVVIRLSKEEVLQEMEEKSKSDEYAKFLFKCHQCVKGFNFEDVLRSHMERHVVKKGWLECDLCHQYCPSVVSLRGHIKSHTTRYKCKVCGCVRLSRQVLLEHHSTFHTQHSVSYTCQLCDFVSVKRTSMQRHVRTAHSKSEKHACEQCGKLFKTIEALRVHNTRHDKSKCLRCDECNRKFIFPSLLKQHKLAVHERDDYYCVECDVKFSSRTNLSLHFKRAKKHRDLSSFKYECDHCSQRFLYRSTLSSHLTSAHGSEKLHWCGACKKRYSSRDSLRAHVRQAHSTAVIPCEQCGKTFNRKSVLRAHLRTHERSHSGDAILPQDSMQAEHDKHKKLDETLLEQSSQVQNTSHMDIISKNDLP